MKKPKPGHKKNQTDLLDLDVKTTPKRNIADSTLAKENKLL
jgi:hypothetical protein